MEYFIGSLVTFVCMSYWYKMFAKIKSKKFFTKVGHTQSQYYILINFARSVTNEISNDINNSKPSQSLNHFDKNHLRVFVFENKAYWILNNKVYSANFNNGFVDKDTTSELDTMTMNKVELKKIMFVIEKLTEGLDSNERRNSGNKDI